MTCHCGYCKNSSNPNYELRQRLIGWSFRSWRGIRLVGCGWAWSKERAETEAQRACGWVK